MKKTSQTHKRSRGRPKKVVVESVTKHVVPQKAGIPAFVEPTEHDLYDELVRLDSFAYAKYNN